MTFYKRNGKLLPDHLVETAKRVRKTGDTVSRREFIVTASTFGASAATAYALIGMTPPARASSKPTPMRGGTVRYQTAVHPLKDPRTYDWTQMANLTRGFMEYLVKYNNDATFTPKLLEDWEVSDDAKTYVLNVRRGILWNDGSDFTAEDVARNIRGWCDREVEGNSMASRFATIINPDTGQALEGAIEIVDSHTVKLNLPNPDITLIAGMADYPAAISHKDYDPNTVIQKPLGTGPYIPESIDVGVKAVMVRNPNHTWWDEGNGAWVDRIEYIDYGTDPAAWVAAIEADEVDTMYQNIGEFIQLVETFDGWRRDNVDTGATICIRTNQLAEVDGIVPYVDVRVRKALQLAVDNNVLLELGDAGNGLVANDTHVGPMHPEYADIGPSEYNPARAVALLEEAGMADFEHNLISIDVDYRKDTCDAAAAQLRDAGIKVRRTILPGSTFWNDWNKYPFSATDWNHRPLGVQALALAYRSGEAWNESGFANDEFDQELELAMATADVDARREIMQRIETIMRDQGVVIQPYWRRTTNFSRVNLHGTEMHIQNEFWPQDIYWEESS